MLVGSAVGWLGEGAGSGVLFLLLLVYVAPQRIVQLVTAPAWLVFSKGHATSIR
jgi:hypothetical protein